MPSCYIHIQYGDIMPLDNTTIGKLNEMTTMINDKSKLDESNIKYVKSLFAELVHGGSFMIKMKLILGLNEGSWHGHELISIPLCIAIVVQRIMILHILYWIHQVWIYH